MSMFSIPTQSCIYHYIYIYDPRDDNSVWDIAIFMAPLILRTPSKMADDMIDISKTDVFIKDYTLKQSQIVTKDNAVLTYCIGEPIRVHVKCKISEHLQKKMKTSNPCRSPLISNLTTSLKRQLSTNVGVKCVVKPCIHKTKHENKSAFHDWHACHIKYSFSSGAKLDPPDSIGMVCKDHTCIY